MPIRDNGDGTFRILPYNEYQESPSSRSIEIDENGSVFFKDQGQEHNWYSRHQEPPPIMAALNDMARRRYIAQESALLIAPPREHSESGLAQWYRDSGSVPVATNRPGYGQPVRTAISPQTYRKDIFDEYHFTPQAQNLLTEKTNFEIGDPYAARNSGGGGYWQPHRRTIYVNTPQDEATIHENTHAYWDRQRGGVGISANQYAKDFVSEVVRVGSDPTLREQYPTAQKLAQEYTWGNDDWRGMWIPEENSWNDWEMYAGLASGVMGDTNRLPPSLRPYYEGLFDTNYVVVNQPNYVRLQR